MNIEEKIWNFTGTGSKLHAFIGGKALCRSSYRETAPHSNKDFCEARQYTKGMQRGVSLCTGCETKFEAAVQRAEDAMQPSTGEGDYLPPAEAKTEVPAGPPKAYQRSGPLTERQHNVLTGLLLGEQHDQIARRLTRDGAAEGAYPTSRQVVSQDVRHVTAKLGCKTSREAVAKYATALAYRKAAVMLRGGRVPVPIDETEVHVNHVLTDMARVLDSRAAALLPS